MIIARATIMAASCARHFLVRSFIVFLLVDVSRPVQNGPLPGTARDRGGVCMERRHDSRHRRGETTASDPGAFSIPRPCPGGRVGPVTAVGVASVPLPPCYARSTARPARRGL